MHFPAFCDTILILRKLVAKNNRRNINNFAKVVPVKEQKIQPHIIGFVEADRVNTAILLKAAPAF